MERINPEDDAALLSQAHQVTADLQMYLYKYQELLQDLEDTIRNYKDTARKITGGE